MDKNKVENYFIYFEGKNRNELLCPDCKIGHNAKDRGDESCFHCDNCGFIECLDAY